MKLSQMYDEQNQKTEEATFCSGQNLTQEAENLSGLSEKQLMQKLREEVQRQKSEGNFNYNALVQSLQKLQPLLGGEAFEKLMLIVESLK